MIYLIGIRKGLFGAESGKRIFIAFLKFRSAFLLFGNALMMNITQFLKGLFPSPAARTAEVLSQECACSLQNKAGGSLYLSAHSIPRIAFMMTIGRAHV